MNIKLLRVIQNSIPNFDVSNTEDIIKAEKFLKREIKLNTEFTPKEVDEIINFFKIYGSRFDILLSNEAVNCIINGNTFSFSRLNFPSVKLKLFEDQSKRLSCLDNEKLLETQHSLCEDFANIFSESIWQFIQTNLLEENWLNLIKVFKYYHSLINYENFEKLNTILTQKNNVIFELIPFEEKYKLLNGQYAYGTNENYFRMLSVIDAYYFEEQVNRINSNVVNYQKKSKYYKVYLAKILIAISNFEAVSDEIIRVLADNKKIAYLWIRYDERIDRSFIDNLLILKSKKFSARAEWIILSVYFLIIFLLYLNAYFLYSSLIIIAFVLEIIVYLVYRERFSIDYFSLMPVDKKDKFRLVLKNIAVNSFVIQIMSLLACLLLLIIAIIAIYSAGFGLFLLARLYMYLKNK